MRYARNQDEARDLLQDGFIKVFKKIKSFKGDSDFYYWLKRVFVNHCTDYVRSAYKKYIRYEDAHDIHAKADLQMEMQATEEPQPIKIEVVIRLMKQLRPDYRTIINMYAIDQMSHEEIAKKLGIKEVSSRSKLMRARNKLKALLKAEGVEQR
ncbi:sigma-70 family RNA polymerase sigma factor [bacterium]|nr:sigma-70 family RNA polymerase sigma factor [bacterium]